MTGSACGRQGEAARRGCRRIHLDHNAAGLRVGHAKPVGGRRSTGQAATLCNAVHLPVVLLGALIDGIAGFFGGWVDDVLGVRTNIFLVMPGLPLMVILAAWLPPGPSTMIGVLVATGWAWNARVLRSKVLSLRKADFVQAAIISGEPALSVLFREILPNMLSLLMTSFIGATIYAIGAQVGLEFIGLGDPSSVTWGTNLYWARNDSALLMGAWWTFVPAGLAIALVGFGLTLLNFGIDEVTNPRLRSEREWQQKLGVPAGHRPETVVVRND